MCFSLGLRRRLKLGLHLRLRLRLRLGPLLRLRLTLKTNVALFLLWLTQLAEQGINDPSTANRHNLLDNESSGRNNHTHDITQRISILTHNLMSHKLRDTMFLFSFCLSDRHTHITCSTSWKHLKTIITLYDRTYMTVIKFILLTITITTCSILIKPPELPNEHPYDPTCAILDNNYYQCAPIGFTLHDQ